MVDLSTLARRACTQPGPYPGEGRGPGRPWAGIVERTPCLWVHWITGACKTAGVSPDDIEVSFGGIRLQMDSVRVRFGLRRYWLCPLCGRRCEAVYLTSQVGCRKCLRLGYLSESHRRSSAWPHMDRILGRHTLYSRKRMPEDAASEMVEQLGKRFERRFEEMLAQVKIEAVTNSEPNGAG